MMTVNRPAQNGRTAAEIVKLWRLAYDSFLGDRIEKMRSAPDVLPSFRCSHGTDREDF